MNENIKAFLQKVTEDSEIQAKFSQIKDPNEAYKLAASIQSGFTKEEFITEMTKIKEAAEENLTDSDLAKSAGGQTVLTMPISEQNTATYYSCGAATAV